jgi:hypothetical protein
MHSGPPSGRRCAAQETLAQHAIAPRPGRWNKKLGRGQNETINAPWIPSAMARGREIPTKETEISITQSFQLRAGSI